MKSAVPGVCRHDGPDEVYDANGWKRWCGNCRAPLNHDGDIRTFNLLFLVPFISALAAVFLFFMVVNAHPAVGGSVVIPSPIPNPPVVRSIP